MDKSQTEKPSTLTEPHINQHRIWEDEHKHPSMFPTVDSNVADPGVVRFWEFICARNKLTSLVGLEICCGKGRNAIWLAGNGATMAGFDFSVTALKAAECLQGKLPATQKIDFRLHDAFDPWPYGNGTFDFIVDNFGTSDIETTCGRDFIIEESARVLKAGGYYFLQIDSAELGFFAERIKNNPGLEKNTLIFPNGKVESVLSEDDLATWNSRYPLKIVELRRHVEYNVEICGKRIPYKYYWIVFLRP